MLTYYSGGSRRPWCRTQYLDRPESASLTCWTRRDGQDPAARRTTVVVGLVLRLRPDNESRDTTHFRGLWRTHCAFQFVRLESVEDWLLGRRWALPDRRALAMLHARSVRSDAGTP